MAMTLAEQLSDHIFEGTDGTVTFTAVDMGQGNCLPTTETEAAAYAVLDVLNASSDPADEEAFDIFSQYLLPEEGRESSVITINAEYATAVLSGLIAAKRLDEKVKPVIFQQLGIETADTYVTAL